MISRNETSLVGEWVLVGDRVVANVACARIDDLISTCLELQAESPDGWSTLYRDPSDGRLWEHSYPQSEMHGGGPPALMCIDWSAAQSKYGILEVHSKYLSHDIEQALGPIHTTLVAASFDLIETRESYSFGNFMACYKGRRSSVQITRDRGQFMVLGEPEAMLMESGLTLAFATANELAEALRRWTLASEA